MNLRVVFEGGAVAELSNVRHIYDRDTGENILRHADVSEFHNYTPTVLAAIRQSFDECLEEIKKENEEESQRTCITCIHHYRDGRTETCNVCASYSLKNDGYHPYCKCLEEKENVSN